LGDANVMGGIALGAAGPAPGPAERAGIEAEEIALHDLGLGNAGRAMGLPGHVERIRRAVDLTEKASLAVVLAGDDGQPRLVPVEDEGRADALADVATNAAVGGNDFDHRLILAVRPEARAHPAGP